MRARHVEPRAGWAARRREAAGGGAVRCLLALGALAACAVERARPDGAPPHGIHPPGALDPSSDGFHGREAARAGWDLGACARCHGDDFAGGAARVGCRDAGCHTEPAGPGACSTCHDAAPSTGAHAAHRIAGVGCDECHAVPAVWDAEGHVRAGGRADPAPAEVVLGARAQLTLDPADRAGAPVFVDGRCDNVYCHGDALHAGGGRATRPRWDDAPAGGCRGCHGAPPPSHAQDRCAACHPAAAPHIDGVVAIGDAPGCSGCHGDASSPAPPRDLEGNVFTPAIGVGAHRAHVEAPSQLRGPIACAECHRVPSTLLAAGHLDSPPPAEVAVALGWQRATATCDSAWCHGPARPVWTASGGAACGTCHGVPPATPSHAPGLPLTACAACHPSTMTAAGAIIVVAGPNGPTSAHLNGAVDAP